jgi:lysophospholipase L1-like esterase
MTLTSAEASTIKDAVDGFNQTIASLASTYSVPTVDANALLTELNVNGLDGATGKFVMVDPATTAFSLDGVHPNNAGYSIVANAFIGKINAR